MAKGRICRGLWEKGSGSKNRLLWLLHFTKWTSEFIVRIAVHGKLADVADEVNSVGWEGWRRQGRQNLKPSIRYVLCASAT